MVIISFVTFNLFELKHLCIFYFLVFLLFWHLVIFFIYYYYYYYYFVCEENHRLTHDPTQSTYNSFWLTCFWPKLNSFAWSRIHKLGLTYCERKKSRHGKMGLNFLTQSEKYLTRTQIFWPEAKTGWFMTRSNFLRVNLT